MSDLLTPRRESPTNGRGDVEELIIAREAADRLTGQIRPCGGGFHESPYGRRMASRSGCFGYVTCPGGRTTYSTLFPCGGQMHANRIASVGALKPVIPATLM
ncbi:uncharacterized protein METZ01_LOCUS497063, partial [marine metagenome]